MPKNYSIASTLLLLSLPFAAHGQIAQTVNDGGTFWNSSLWGSPASAPTSGNNYVTATGLMGSSSTALGTPGVTGRVRDNGSTFAGDSLTIIADTKLLMRQFDGSTSTANITLDGGIIRLSPNSGGSGILAGTLSVASSSVIGSVQTSATSLTINSVLTGSGDLRLAAGNSDSQSLIFNGDLSGYTGVMNVGGGNNLVTVSFAQATTSRTYRSPTAISPQRTF